MTDRGHLIPGKGVRLGRRRRETVSERGLRLYDALPAAEAVRRAWVDPGLAPAWHDVGKAEVAARMPLLARALDRLADDGRRRPCGS